MAGRRIIYSYGPQRHSYKLAPPPPEVLEDPYVLWIERLVRGHQLRQLRALGFPHQKPGT